ncbi:hypothetical protein SARC_12859, partial [Sphaeroforma arctica JP610]
KLDWANGHGTTCPNELKSIALAANEPGMQSSNDTTPVLINGVYADDNDWHADDSKDPTLATDNPDDRAEITMPPSDVLAPATDQTGDLGDHGLDSDIAPQYEIDQILTSTALHTDSSQQQIHQSHTHTESHESSGGILHGSPHISTTAGTDTDTRHNSLNASDDGTANAFNTVHGSLLSFDTSTDSQIIRNSFTATQSVFHAQVHAQANALAQVVLLKQVNSHVPQAAHTPAALGSPSQTALSVDSSLTSEGWGLATHDTSDCDTNMNKKAAAASSLRNSVALSETQDAKTKDRKFRARKRKRIVHRQYARDGRDEGRENTFFGLATASAVRVSCSWGGCDQQHVYDWNRNGCDSLFREQGS